MRICLATTSFLPHLGGAEIVVHNLALALTGLGHEVTVLAPRYSRRVQAHVPYTVQPVMPGTFPLIAGHERLGSLYFLADLARIKVRRFDIINLHFALPLGPILARFRRLLGIPLVLTFHGTDIQMEPSIGYGLRLDPRQDHRVRAAVAGFDGLVAISSSIRNDLEALRSGTPVFVIQNGVDVARFRRPGRGRFRERLGIPNDAPLVLAVGRYHVKKGFEYLVQAMPRVAEAATGARCVIVGRGTAGLIPLVERLRLQNTVFLVQEIPVSMNGTGPPRLPADAMIDAYLDSDVFVSPSLIEGCSLAVLEAMAAGLPIVAADAPGNRDALEHGRNALLCRPRDVEDLGRQVTTLLKDTHTRSVLGQQARETAQRYDWPAVARRYVQAFSEVQGRAC